MSRMGNLAPVGEDTFPNRLFDDGRDVLARFGYRYAGAGDWFEDWSEMWDLLRGDFATDARPDVPAYADLSESQRAAAEDYMARRLTADRRLVACEKAHREMLAEGINNDLVELYSAVREAYEESVEAFGDARERLAALL